jgi:hypothetical protein
MVATPKIWDMASDVMPGSSTTLANEDVGNPSLVVNALGIKGTELVAVPNRLQDGSVAILSRMRLAMSPMYIPERSFSNKYFPVRSNPTSLIQLLSL